MGTWPCVYGPVVVHKTVGVCVCVYTCRCEHAVEFWLMWGPVGLCAGRWTSVDTSVLGRVCVCVRACVCMHLAC